MGHQGSKEARAVPGGTGERVGLAFPVHWEALQTRPCRPCGVPFSFPLLSRALSIPRESEKRKKDCLHFQMQD